MTNFSCSECGAPILILDGNVTRHCQHDHAPIIANLTATAYGSASFASNPPSKVEKAISRILDALKIRRV